MCSKKLLYYFIDFIELRFIQALAFDPKGKGLLFF